MGFPTQPFISFGLKMASDLVTQTVLQQLQLSGNIDLLCRDLRAVEAFFKDLTYIHSPTECDKNLMREALDVIYEADDVLDKLQLKANRYAAGKNPFNCEKIARKIDTISRKLSQIIEHKKNYNFGSIKSCLENTSTSSEKCLQKWRLFCPEKLENYNAYMKGDEKMMISKRLLDGAVQDRGVIPIVGIAGIGKTTLAAAVYKILIDSKATGIIGNDHASTSEDSVVRMLTASATSVSTVSLASSENNSFSPAFGDDASSNHSTAHNVYSCFDVYAWVSVTQNYTPEEFFRKLLKAVADITVSLEKLEIEKMRRLEVEEMKRTDLESQLCNILKGKRYLIVLDDVWTTDVWNDFTEAFPDEKNGSRVILTTRSVKVATHASSDSDPHFRPYHVQPLNEEESLELFMKSVFRISECPQNLREPALQLSNKCYGLPLALVIFGDYVRAQPKDPGTWLDLVKSTSWEMPTDGIKPCLEIIAQSYRDLPYHIKQCFFYLSAFPEGYNNIPASTLIEMWIAEGLIATQGNQKVDEVAKQVLDVLTKRGLVQIKNAKESIQIHDLVRMLALIEAREHNFLQVEKIPSSGTVPSAEQDIRRLSLHEDSTPYFDLQARKPRALLVFHKKRRSRCWKKTLHKIKYKFGSSMKCLRVLELEGMHELDILEDKVKIESMQLLKYLGLRDTNLCHLPEQVADLHNLMTLNLRGTQIEKLPKEIWKLQMLRNLYLNSNVCPTKIDSYTNLQVLQHAQHGDWVEHLSSLTSLRRLSIEAINSWDNLVRALEKLEHLESLKLSSGCLIPLSVIMAISHHEQLRELKLQGNILHQVLNVGLEEYFPCHLTKLTLVKSRLTQDPMAMLEKLPYLMILKLKSDACYIEKITCSNDGFKSLQYLEIKAMTKLQEWSLEDGAMPVLTHLHISQCAKLAVPIELKQVTSLQVMELPDMLPDFVQQIKSTVPKTISIT